MSQRPWRARAGFCQGSATSTSVTTCRGLGMPTPAITAYDQCDPKRKEGNDD
jgi:hypothetical protein